MRMRSRQGRLLVGALVAAGLAVVGPMGASDARSAPSLSVSPRGDYVAGQKITYTGNIGMGGVRKVHLQSFMGRPGDAWTDVPGSTRKTAGDGDFRFTFPAPSMFGIKFRVATKGSTTPAVTFQAASQDLTLTSPKQVLFGDPFAIDVDTTPSIYRRPDVHPPVFPGRTLTLQIRKADGTWMDTPVTAQTDSRGLATLRPTIELPNIGVPDLSVTYRVVESAISSNGNRIGWMPSFPVTVVALPSLGGILGGVLGGTQTVTTSSPSHAAAAAPTTERRTAATAGQTYQWGTSLYDFAWEFGESLTSKPYRGTLSTTKRQWRWLDSIMGTGRVALLNGGMGLDSGRGNPTDVDKGTSSATLQGASQAYGRWEAKIRTKVLESGNGTYHSVIQLVPANASDYDCGAHNITVADVPAHGSTYQIGVDSPGASWTATRQGSFGDEANAFAVEVAKGHITWFVNSKPVGTVQSPAAISGVPMTLRMSLVAGGNQEMNHTQFISDWQRSWSLDRGRQITSGAGLNRQSANNGC